MFFFLSSLVLNFSRSCCQNPWQCEASSALREIIPAEVITWRAKGAMIGELPTVPLVIRQDRGGVLPLLLLFRADPNTAAVLIICRSWVSLCEERELHRGRWKPDLLQLQVFYHQHLLVKDKWACDSDLTQIHISEEQRKGWSGNSLLTRERRRDDITAVWELQEWSFMVL